jgi:hypothetical protein
MTSKNNSSSNGCHFSLQGNSASCKNEMQYSLLTDYRKNCDTNEEIFKRYGIPRADGTSFRQFLQNNANLVRADLFKQQSNIAQDNPTGCKCVYRPPKPEEINPNHFSLGQPTVEDSMLFYNDLKRRESCQSWTLAHGGGLGGISDNFKQYPFQPAKFDCKTYRHSDLRKQIDRTMWPRKGEC